MFARFSLAKFDRFADIVALALEIGFYIAAFLLLLKGSYGYAAWSLVIAAGYTVARVMLKKIERRVAEHSDDA